jgi:hypothetical protein
MIISGITSSDVKFTNVFIEAPTLTTFPIETLIVASGGGGGGALSDQGGGGGGGGLIYLPELTIQKGTTYPIVVGASVAYRTQGQDSSAFGKTALGGGFGAGSNNTQNPSSGGSGGGGSWATTGTSRVGAAAGQPGTASGGYGNKGGNGYAGENGAGGGGAGGSGGNDSAGSFSNLRQIGGPGLAYSIDGTSRYYSGGGGSTQSTGGLGSGSTNYGGGGNGSSTGSGGNSGPGIVIIKYPDTYDAATTTGSPTVVVTGGYRIYTFTGSGSVTF